MEHKEKYFSPKVWLTEPRIVCGLMSGTSLDGVDAALVRFSSDSEGKHNFELLGFLCLPYKPEIRERLLKLSGSLILSESWRIVSEISELNFHLSQIYSESVSELCRINNFDIDSIHLIGMHGQTVWHEPQITVDGRFASTLQLGNPAILAVKLNVPVVSDFRSADIALGGQGAPLIPIFDKEFLSDESIRIITLNIGGIANITLLPKSGEDKEIIAFDTGPGNILIDAFVRKHYNMDYDADGKIAENGMLIEKLFEQLKKINYIKMKHPKSTGRDLFNEELINNLLTESKIQNPESEDIIHTLTKFTAWSIAENIRLFRNTNSKIIASGGGVKNQALMKYLSNELPNSTIITSDEIGINSEEKEAIGFAYLAFRNLAGLNGNIPSVTGASRESKLGSLTMPF